MNLIQLIIVAILAVTCIVAALLDMWWLCYASAGILAVVLVGPAWHYLLLLE